MVEKIFFILRELNKGSYTIHDSEYLLANCLFRSFYLTKDTNNQNDLIQIKFIGKYITYVESNT